MLTKNVDLYLKDFESVFGHVDPAFVRNSGPAIYDSIFLTHNIGYEYEIERDNDGYNTMHYCVASLIANHKYKPKEEKVITRHYYYSSENAEQEIEATNRWERSVRIFLQVLNHGISINAPRINKSCIDESPLMYAIEKHAPLDVLKLLIKYGAYMDQDLVSGTSVLSICYYADYIEAAKLLLDLGADPNVIDDGFYNPLAYVFDEYDEETPDFNKMDKFIHLFLAYGSVPDYIDGFDDYCKDPEGYFKDKTWMTDAVLDHKKKTFKLLLKYRKDD